MSRPTLLTMETGAPHWSADGAQGWRFGTDSEQKRGHGVGEAPTLQPVFRVTPDKLHSPLTGPISAFPARSTHFPPLPATLITPS